MHGGPWTRHEAWHSHHGTWLRLGTRADGGASTVRVARRPGDRSTPGRLAWPIASEETERVDAPMPEEPFET